MSDAADADRDDAPAGAEGDDAVGGDETLAEIRERKAEKLTQRLETPDEPVHVEGPAHFEEVVTERSPVLVDFYADWCGPCKQLEPIVDSIAAETDGTVAKVDIDAHQGLATSHQVQGVPTLLLFVDGEPVERLVGAQDAATLRSLIESHA